MKELGITGIILIFIGMLIMYLEFDSRLNDRTGKVFCKTFPNGHVVCAVEQKGKVYTWLAGLNGREYDQ